MSIKTVRVSLTIDQFLTHLDTAGSARNTILYYRQFLREFRPFAGERRLGDVTPSLMREWIGRRYGNARPQTQHDASRAVCRLLNWAVETGRLDKSPLRNYKKPHGSHREVILSGADYANMIKASPPALRDAIKFLWHTGARPQELRMIEAVWIGDRKIIFPLASSKGKRKRRVIYLDAMASGIVARRAEHFPTGPIFRNHRGRPWTTSAFTQAFFTLRRHTGIKGACAYAIRHTWITRMLERGAGVAVVAALAGNSPAIMLKVYAHVAENEEHLRRHLA